MREGWAQWTAIHVAIIAAIAAAAWIIRVEYLKEELRERRIAQRVRLLDAPGPGIAPGQEGGREEAEAFELREEDSRKEEEALKLREEAERKQREALHARQERERALAEKRQLGNATRGRLQAQLDRELGSATPTPGGLLPGDPSAQARWADSIRGKIKQNIVLLDIPGNPEAVFDVELLPTGEVLSVRLRKSSGVKAYDEAVERAILKSSPLPLPDRPEVFQRALRITFRPRDEYKSPDPKRLGSSRRRGHSEPLRIRASARRDARGRNPR
jgi:colicin import membrane protein